MNKKVIILLFVAVALLGLVALLNFSPFGTKFVWNLSNEGTWLLPLVIIASFIDSFNPCAFSVFLLTIAFMFSLGKDRMGILKVGLIYIAGIFTVYMLIGLGILQVLHLFNTPHFMAKVGALLLVVVGGLGLINDLFPKFPIKLKIPGASHNAIAKLMEKASLPAAFGLGVLVGLCEFPCTGGPYLMVLGLLHDQSTYYSGLVYLLLYNVIFVAPLLLMLFIAGDKQLLEKINIWRKSESRHMRVWGGAAMVILGIIILIIS